MNATALFPFFSDYHDDLGDKVVRGRCEFLKKLHNASDDDLRSAPNPQAESTFRVAQLQWDELGKPEHAEVLARYRRLLTVRRAWITPRLEGICERCGNVRVFAPGAFAVDWNLPHGEVLALDANLCGESHGGFSPRNGRLLWLEGSEPAQDQLAPWSVRWTLSSPAR